VQSNFWKELMTARKHSKGGRRNREKIEAGDVILLPQSDGKYTLACILGLWPKLPGIMTIALLAKEIGNAAPSPEELRSLVGEQIAKRELIAVLSTTSGTAEVGEWRKIGRVANLGVDELLPKVPFRTGSLVGAEHQSAPLVEALVEAYRGLAKWDEALPGRPGHLKSLLFHSTSSVH
jgi:hypothetical protein